jgi:hypothetical protein
MARRFPDAAAFAVLMALAACADAGDVATPVAPRVPPAPPPVSPASVAVAPSPALTPSPTPQQVIDAVPIGRVDPFAPTTTSATAAAPATTTAAALPRDLRLIGVIGSGGDVRAFVQHGSQTGALCPGARGRCADGASEPVLLPGGWTVSAIDAASARLVLSSGRQRRILALTP